MLYGVLRMYVRCVSLILARALLERGYRRRGVSVPFLPKSLFDPDSHKKNKELLTESDCHAHRFVSGADVLAWAWQPSRWPLTFLEWADTGILHVMI